MFFHIHECSTSILDSGLFIFVVVSSVIWGLLNQPRKYKDKYCLKFHSNGMFESDILSIIYYVQNRLLFRSLGQIFLMFVKVFYACLFDKKSKIFNYYYNLKFYFSTLNVIYVCDGKAEYFWIFRSHYSSL